MNNRRRRLLMLLASSVAVSPVVSASGKLLSTPRQSAGPFYPVQLPLDDDNDLTQVAGRSGRAQGAITDLSGTIVDANGRPLENLRIEIWQCDANGRYRHPHENGPGAVDENFQGHGHALTDAFGRYRFRTIRPVPYPGRAPHIHVAVFADGADPFVTQLYVKDEPLNQRDFLFNHVPADRRHLVVAEFKPAQHGDAQLRATFDIILDRSVGTPIQR
jgi:protocatechuate 3,4-dioxygenase beta subunit